MGLDDNYSRLFSYDYSPGASATLGSNWYSFGGFGAGDGGMTAFLQGKAYQNQIAGQGLLGTSGSPGAMVNAATIRNQALLMGAVLNGAHEAMITNRSMLLNIGDIYVPSADAKYSCGGYFNPALGAAPGAGTPGAVNPAGATDATVISQGGTKDLNFWKSYGYNEEKGRQLVANARRSKYIGQKHQCGAVVRDSINMTCYGYKKYDRFHAACNTGDEFLSRDGNFRKIIPDWNVSPADFPPGAIIIYRGDSGSGDGYVKGDDRGHIEYAAGFSNKGVSNYELNIKPQYIKEVWIPV